MVDPASTRSASDRFDALFRAHYADLYRYAVRRCATSEDAEDLVAEVFAVAWRRLDDLPPGDEARLWLFGTARLLRMNDLRSATRRKSMLDKFRAVRSRITRPDIATSVADRSQVRHALASLSDSDQEILLLSVWEGLSSTEVAAVLEVSPAAARKRLERARQRFREALPEFTATPPSQVLTAEEA